jgi:hypothetical protein
VVSFPSKYYLKKEKGLAEIFITTAGNFVKTRENVYFQKKTRRQTFYFILNFWVVVVVCVATRHFLNETCVMISRELFG